MGLGPSPSATPATRPGARTGRGPGAGPRKPQVGPHGRAHLTPPAARWGFDSNRVSPPRLWRQGGGRRQHLPGRMRGPAGAHTCARAERGPPGPRPLCGAGRAAAAPGGKGTRRRRHLPVSTSSSAGGDSRADSPWHHLPPPPPRRRRLPTAHPAPPTDTTAGVPVPARPRTPGGRERSGRRRDAVRPLGSG